jgi:hypothetical protein
VDRRIALPDNGEIEGTPRMDALATTVLDQGSLTETSAKISGRIVAFGCSYCFYPPAKAPALDVDWG